MREITSPDHFPEGIGLRMYEKDKDFMLLTPKDWSAFPGNERGTVCKRRTFLFLLTNPQPKGKVLVRSGN